MTEGTWSKKLQQVTIVKTLSLKELTKLYSLLVKLTEEHKKSQKDNNNDSVKKSSFVLQESEFQKICPYDDYNLDDVDSISSTNSQDLSL